jgi:RNA polymerase sigma-70 factor (ECF subfamily)
VNSGWKNGTSAFSDWQQWLAEYAPRFLLFARQQARCEADAQDLVQEAVVEAWQRQANGATPPISLVFSTIRRRAIDLARREDRRAGREAASTFGEAEPWFDPSIEDRERSRLLQQAMTSMSDIYRDVVTLKVWGELSFVEIAEMLDIPANTAASRYRYGLAELRKLTEKVFL